VVLAPTPVQGDSAAPAIVTALEALNRRSGIDVVILARGGGSMEELWPFNEETVARAVFGSGVPVVSAVGHETDYTISDFVADLRAPTPSAAAEMVAPDWRMVARQVEGVMLGSTIALKNRLNQNVARIERAEHRLATALPDTGRLRERLVSLVRHASSVLARSLDQRAQGANARVLQLRSLDPRATLARGYAVVQLREGKPDGPSGQAITSVKQVKGKDRLDVHVKDGKFPAEVSRQYGF
jgi:exodeoxyribonuclease VII large subunit